MRQSTTVSHDRCETRSRPRAPISRSLDSGHAKRRSIASPSAPGIGRGHDARHVVLHELERPARVGRRDHGLAGEEALDRHVAVVLVLRGIEGRPAPGVEVDHVARGHEAEEVHPVGDPERRREAAQVALVRARPAIFSRAPPALAASARSRRSTRLMGSRRPA